MGSSTCKRVATPLVAAGIAAMTLATLSIKASADSLTGQPVVSSGDGLGQTQPPASLTPGATSVLRPGATTGTSSPPSQTAVSPTAGAPSGGQAIAAATVDSPAGPAEAAVSSEVQATIEQVLSGSPSQRLRYQHAAAEFPAFCHNWARMLHDREVNNLDHLSWQQRGGYETASYTGYGKIESCECKESEGLPIGKVKYEEMNYYLTGKTIDDAKHSSPKLVGVVNTLEIFSWEKNKWFY